MTSSPRAARRPWSDARFLIGIGLVVASIAAVWLLVDASRQTTPVLQSTRTIVTGEVLSSADFRVVDVGLGALSDGYVSPGELEPGTVATRTISSGELLPTSAVADAARVHTTTVVIESTAPVAASVTPGAVVEVWHAPPREETRGYEEPRVLVAAATVAKIVEPSGMVSSGAVSLELVIDRTDVAAVLGAVTSGSALSVVALGAGS